MTDFTLRPWRKTDVPSLARYANDAGIAANLRDVFPHPYTRSDAETYIRMCMERGEQQLCRAVVINGEAAGSILVAPRGDVRRKSAELGYWLARPFWGQGIMTAAARQMCREAFARFDIVRIYAEIYAYNTASRRVVEKNGFTLEGILKQSIFKDGRLLDSCLYALLKEELPV